MHTHRRDSACVYASTLIKVIIHHLINNKHNNKNFDIDFVSFEFQYMLDSEKKNL